METREILLKANRIVVALERLERRQNPSDDNDLGRREGDFAQSGARGGEHRQAGGAGPGGQVGGLSRHDDTELGESGLRPGNELM